MSKPKNEPAALEKVVTLESALAGRGGRQQLCSLLTPKAVLLKLWCVAEQQPPTTGGWPALIYYTL